MNPRCGLRVFLVLVASASVAACGLVLGLKDPQLEELSLDAAADGRSPDSNGGTCDGGLDRDPHNCGRCGHDCQGGACVDETCQPIVLSKESDPPYDIGVNDDGVFWTTGFELAAGAKVRKCSGPTCDAGAETMYSSAGKPRGRGLVVSSSHVYFMGPFDLQRCSTKGCGGDPTNIYITAEGRLGRSRGNRLHLTQPSSMDLSARLVGCTMPGCSDAKTLAEVIYPFAMMSDSRFLYWGTFTGDEPTDVIQRCSVADCTVQTIASHTRADALELTPSGNYLLWIGDNELQRCVPDDCERTIETLYAGKTSIDAVAADDSDVYFTGDRGVYKCALSGCNDAPTLLRASAGRKPSIALDATSVYWTNETDRTVTKLAK